MIWQDIVISVWQWILGMALVPTLWSKKEKPELFTSVLTSVILYVFSFTFATMPLWIAAASSFVNGTLWLTLAVQRYRQQKEKPVSKRGGNLFV